MSSSSSKETLAPATETYELWAKLGFSVCGLAACMTLYLALRPGGERPVQIYGLWFVPGLLAALLLAISLVWGATHLPLLQRGRLKGWIALSACLWWSVFPFPYPSSHEGHASPVTFQLPFSEEWSVIFAGNRYRENPLVLRPETRFGVGLQRTEAGEVLAPCAATVRAIDAVPGFEERLVMVLDVAPEEALVLRGIEREGLAVEVGDSLGAGTHLGRTDRLDLYLHDPSSEGIPMRFSSYLEDGRRVEKGELRLGTIVSAQADNSSVSEH